MFSKYLEIKWNEITTLNNVQKGLANILFNML